MTRALPLSAAPSVHVTKLGPLPKLRPMTLVPRRIEFPPEERLQVPPAKPCVTEGCERSAYAGKAHCRACIKREQRARKRTREKAATL